MSRSLPDNVCPLSVAISLGVNKCGINKFRLDHLWPLRQIFIARQHTDARYWYSNFVCPFVSVAFVRYLASKSGVTLKTGLGFIQCHWKCHHLIDRIYEFLFTFHSNYGDILYCLRDIATCKNREIFMPHLYLAPPQGTGDSVGISWRCLMLIKLEWLGYRMVKKLWRYVKPFSSDTGTSRTDGRTDRQTDGRTGLLYQYRASVCWRAMKIN